MSIVAFSPPSAQTENSIALVWHKVEAALCYKVSVNNKPQAKVCCTDYTCGELDVDTEYNFKITAYGADGIALAQSDAFKVKTKPKSKTFNISDFGAVADSNTVNTAAIQKAIDACCEGGTVIVPKGVFLTGALFLKSNMTLCVEKHGRLLGSADTLDYPLLEYLWEGQNHICYASLINTKTTENYENIAIIGNGVIDANGMLLFAAEISLAKGKRGRAVCIYNTNGLYFKDITIRQAPSWCVHPILCSNVSINNIKVFTKCDEFGNVYKDVFNGDGIDPEFCENVYIFNSLIASQDDCIAIKSGRDEQGRAVGVVSKNIRITNCRFESGFGIAMGSEMAAGIDNVLVQDCKFNNTFSIGTVKAPRGRGNFIKNVIYDNCTMINRDKEHSDCKWFKGAIYIDQFYSHDNPDLEEFMPINEGTSKISNITFKNIVIDTIGGNAVYLSGLPESPLENIVLQNIQAIGKYGMKAYHINGLTLKNVSVEAKNGKDKELKFVK